MRADLPRFSALTIVGEDRYINKLAGLGGDSGAIDEKIAGCAEPCPCEAENDGFAGTGSPRWRLQRVVEDGAQVGRDAGRQENQLGLGWFKGPQTTKSPLSGFPQQDLDLSKTCVLQHSRGNG